jgi:hypothetical protein
MGRERGRAQRVRPFLRPDEGRVGTIAEDLVAAAREDIG